MVTTINLGKIIEKQKVQVQWTANMSQREGYQSNQKLLHHYQGFPQWVNHYS